MSSSEGATEVASLIGDILNRVPIDGDFEPAAQNSSFAALGDNDVVARSAGDDILRRQNSGGESAATVALRGMHSNSGDAASLASASSANLASPSVPNSGERLYVRVSQPVESCDLEPFAAVVPRMISLQDSGVQLQYRWLRSKENLPCAYSKCPHNNNVIGTDTPTPTAKPVAVTPPRGGGKGAGASASAASGAGAGAGGKQAGNSNSNSCEMQCVICYTAGAPAAMSTFCSARCLRRGWSEHVQYHAVDRRAPAAGRVFLSPMTAVTATGNLAAADKDEVLWLQATRAALADAVEEGPTRVTVGSGAVSAAAAAAAAAAATVAARPPATPALTGPGARRGGNAAAAAASTTALASASTTSSSSLDGVDVGDGVTSWTEIARSRVLRPSAADIGHRLRLEVVASLGPDRTITQVADTAYVLPLPPSGTRRKFVLSPSLAASPSIPEGPARHRLLRDVAIHGLRDKWGGAAVRVLSYNILAEVYAGASMYPYVPLWQLTWNYRCGVVLRELLSYDADVLCLQECQSDHFDTMLLPRLQAAGYEALYKTKTREAMGAEGKIDGCALFYKRSRIQLLSAYVIELNEPAHIQLRAEAMKLEAQLQARPPLISQAEYDSRRATLETASRRLCKDNVAQVAILQLVADPSGRPLDREVPMLVCNTHLHWDPQLADVKLWQISCLVKEIEKLQQTTAATLCANGVLPPGQTSFPLLLCGDLNSEPDSAVYKLLSNNVIFGRRVDLSPSDLPSDPCSILAARGRLGHNLQLQSLYNSVLGSEPEFTNLTRDYVGTLDYCFANVDCVRSLSAAVMPSREALLGGRGKTRSKGFGGTFTSSFSRAASDGSDAGGGPGGSGVPLVGPPTTPTRTSASYAADVDEDGEEGSEALPNAQHPSDHVPLIFEVEVGVGPGLQPTASALAAQLLAGAGNASAAAAASAAASLRSTSPPRMGGDGSSGSGNPPPGLSSAGSAFYASVKERMAGKLGGPGTPSGSSTPGATGAGGGGGGGPGTPGTGGIAIMSRQGSGGTDGNNDMSLQDQVRRQVLRRAASNDSGPGGPGSPGPGDAAAAAAAAAAANNMAYQYAPTVAAQLQAAQRAAALSGMAPPGMGVGAPPGLGGGSGSGGGGGGPGAGGAGGNGGYPPSFRPHAYAPGFGGMFSPGGSAADASGMSYGMVDSYGRPTAGPGRGGPGSGSAAAGPGAGAGGPPGAGAGNDGPGSPSTGALSRAPPVTLNLADLISRQLGQ